MAYSLHKLHHAGCCLMRGTPPTLVVVEFLWSRFMMSSQLRAKSFLAGLCFGLGLTACVKEKPSKLAFSDQQLILTGQVITSAGFAASPVEVYVGSNLASAALTGEPGRFEILLNSDDLLINKAQSPYDLNSFRLYFHDPESGHKGVSPLISYEERGRRDIGTIQLAAPVMVKGQVKFKSQRGALVDGAGALVRLGQDAVIAGNDGSFTFAAAPQGSLFFSVTADHFVPHLDTIDTKGGRGTLPISGPIVLFGDYGVSGVLMSIPQLEEEGNLKEHRFSHAFLSRASQDARWLRFHHDAAKLEEAVWMNAIAELRYEFPSDGGHTLYYQYADALKTQLSPVFQINVDIDVFRDTDGFTVGDGSGVSSSAKVELIFDLPEAADRLRVAESQSELIGKSWSPATERLDYIFRPNELENQGRHIYVQYADSFGSESLVFKQDVELELFTTDGPLVEGGAEQVTRADILVQMQPPPETSQIRIVDDSGNINNAPWLKVSSEVLFSLKPLGSSSSGGSFGSGGFSLGGGSSAGSSGSDRTIGGRRTISVQYENRYGFISPVFQTQVEVEIFPTVGSPFSINGDSGITHTPLVYLDIDLPKNAYEMRVFVLDRASTLSFDGFGMGSSGSKQDIWLPAASYFPYLLPQRGFWEIYLQFRDPSGNRSSIYKNAIEYDPFGPTGGDYGFAINEGAELTTNPELTFDVQLADSAAFMAFSTFAPTSSAALSWLPAAPQSSLMVRGRGLKEIFFTQMTSDGSVSPTLMSSILYEPFPFVEDAVVINEGDVTTRDRLVQLGFHVPENAVAMKFHHDLNALRNQPYGDLVATSGYTLPLDYGLQHVYLQFKNEFGDESLVFSDSIILERTDGDIIGDALVINGGDEVTASTAVSLDLNLPANATGVRFTQTPAAIASEPWLAVASSLPFTLAGPEGVQNVYMQYQTEDGQVSSVYVDGIVLDL